MPGHWSIRSRGYWRAAADMGPFVGTQLLPARCRTGRWGLVGLVLGHGCSLEHRTPARDEQIDRFVASRRRRSGLGFAGPPFAVSLDRHGGRRSNGCGFPIFVVVTAFLFVPRLHLLWTMAGICFFSGPWIEARKPE